MAKRPKKKRQLTQRTLKQKLAIIDKDFPFVLHTGVGRLSSTVRRMKAQKEMDIPISYRSGNAISAELGKKGDEMTEEQWEHFYQGMCGDLKRDYPDYYLHIFPEQK